MGIVQRTKELPIGIGLNWFDFVRLFGKASCGHCDLGDVMLADRFDDLDEAW